MYSWCMYKYCIKLHVHVLAGLELHVGKIIEGTKASR